jgi:hypothetical protein
MSVTVEDGRVVVGVVEEVDVNDFLEYAEAAIKRFGWRNGPRKEVTKDDMPAVAEKDGLSLHDAIGYTNVMLAGQQPKDVGTPTSKDGFTASRGKTNAVNMRDEMTKAVKAVLPKGEDDKTFNDKAKSVDEIIGVLRSARGVKG